MHTHRHRPRLIAIAAPRPSFTAPGHALILAALVALALLLFSALPRAHAGLFGGPIQVKAQAGLIKIPVAEVSDGKAHFYSYNAGAKEVRFFALKSKDGVIRTALDACDVCYREKKGYKQDGDVMICNNCGMKFHSTKVMEVKGGCNPSPLARSVEGSTVVIREADLKAGVGYF